MAASGTSASNGGSDAPAWAKVWDPTAGAYYFYNEATGECVWDQPAGYVEPAPSAAPVRGQAHAATRVQSVFRGRKAREQAAEVAVAREAARAAGRTKAVWVESWDPTANAPYYYNVQTEACVWERPAEFVEGATDELCEAVVKIQCMYRVRAARRRLDAKRSQKGGGGAGGKGKGKGKGKAGESKHEADAKALVDKTKNKAYGELNTGMTKGAVDATWLEQWDPTANAAYYYNTKTGECSWEKPKDFVAGGEDETMAATIKIQSMFRGHKAREEVQTRMETLKLKQGVVDKVVWVEQYDPSSGFYYYYNTQTTECQWEKPPDFVPGATDDMCTAALKIQCMFRARAAKRKVAAATEEAIRRRGGSLVDKTKSKAYGELNTGMTAGSGVGWIEQWDPNAQAHYYYHTETGESQWEKPADFVPGGKDDTVTATLKIQSLFRGHKAREEVQTKVDALKMTEGTAGKALWVVQFDPNYGKNYYYNTESGECSWEEPNGFAPGGRSQVCDAAVKIQCCFRSRVARRRVAEARSVSSTLKSKHYGELSAAATRGAAAGWVEQWDPGARRHYYYHTRTGECAWEKPAGFERSVEDDAMLSAVKIQSMFRGHAGRERAAQRAQQLKMRGGRAGREHWVEQWDPTSGRFYYYNSRTAQSQWEKPAGFTPGLGDPGCTAAIRIQCAFRRRRGARAVDEKRKARRVEVSRAQPVRADTRARVAAADEADVAAATQVQRAVRGKRAREFVKQGAGMSKEELAAQRRVVAQRDATLEKWGQRLDEAQRKFDTVEKQVVLLMQHRYRSTDPAERGVADAPEVRPQLNTVNEAIRMSIPALTEATASFEGLKARRIAKTCGHAVELVDRAVQCMRRCCMTALRTYEPEFVRAWALLAQTKACRAYRESEFLIERLVKVPKDMRELRHRVRDTESGIRSLIRLDPEARNHGAFLQALRAYLRSHDFWETWKPASVMLSNADRAFVFGERLCEAMERASMKLEEAAQSDLNKRIGAVKHDLEHREAFVALCREAWARGKAIAVSRGEPGAPRVRSALADTLTSPTAAAAAQAAKVRAERARREREDATRARREGAVHAATVAAQVADASFATPWEAAAGGATTQRLEVLLREEAMRRQNIENMRFHVDDPDPDTGAKLLHTAAMFGHVSIIERLLEHGASINGLDTPLTRATPLHYAARAGNDSSAACLLEAGADPAAVDGSGETPLHLAARGGYYKLVKRLLPPDAGATDTELQGATIEDLLPFAGPVRRLPRLWLPLQTRNHRGKLPSELTRSNALRKAISMGERGLALRRLMAEPLAELVEGDQPLSPEVRTQRAGTVPNGGGVRRGESFRRSKSAMASDGGLFAEDREYSSTTGGTVGERRAAEKRKRQLQKGAVGAMSASTGAGGYQPRLTYTSTGGFGDGLSSGTARKWAHRFRALGGSRGSPSASPST